MVIHCGEKSLELDERTLYMTNLLPILGTHIGMWVRGTDFSDSNHRFWTELFDGLAELACYRFCDQAIEGDEIHKHVELLRLGGDLAENLRHQMIIQSSLRKKLEQLDCASPRFIAEEEEVIAEKQEG